MIMHYQKNKRNKTDQCNMCLEEKDLTWDHVPPQGCGNSSHTEIKSAFELLTSKTSVKPMPQSVFPSQNGIKYRTLCKDCHEPLSKMDIELKDFSSNLSRYLSSELILPESTTLKVRPKKIILSLLGHLLAAKVTVENIVFDVMVRDVFLNSKPIPDNLNIFYWIHPYPETVIMRDFGMPSVRGDFSKQMGFFQLIKYYPIAFLISDVEKYANLPSLKKFNLLEEDDEEDILINFANLPDVNWPERVDNGNFIFGGSGINQAIRARQRLSK